MKKIDQKKTHPYSCMENRDGFWCGHMQIQNAPFMSYLENVRLHTQQLLHFNYIWHFLLFNYILHLSSSFFVESTQNENNDKPKTNLTYHYFLWVHKNKTKEDDDEHQLFLVVSGCIETKQEKMTTNVNSLLFSLGAQKQNKTKQDNNKHRLIVVFYGCTETKKNKMMTSVGLLSSFLGA